MTGGFEADTRTTLAAALVSPTGKAGSSALSPRCARLRVLGMTKPKPTTPPTGTPPTPAVWNHHLAAKTRFGLWGSITYGQNLEPQEVSSERARDVFLETIVFTRMG